MSKELRILLTNDDGIHAPGLETLEAIAAKLSDDGWVVAPETEQSGASRALTLNEPLRLRQINERKFAVKGTPTDCVMMGVKHVIEGRIPDLILSGVNRGSNLAEDVTYSGTVAAAMEGLTIGIPSMALSQTNNWKELENTPWSCAEELAPKLIEKLYETGWPESALLNINFPMVMPDEVKGVQITTQGRRDQSSATIIGRKDQRGNDYFWLGLKRGVSDVPEGTDLHAIYNGYISVTPLHLELTDHDTHAQLQAVFSE
jgi:5'/3'-nucleotidase SurE